jgi:hypothetical protein
VFATTGGLMSYGMSRIGSDRDAASYVGRVLRGEKPGDLPVQALTTFELIVNLKTTRALGLEIPATLLAHTGQVQHRRSGSVQSFNCSRSACSGNRFPHPGGHQRNGCPAGRLAASLNNAGCRNGRTT